MSSTQAITEVQEKLQEGMSEFEVIDCHEHLGPEKNRVETEVDVFTFFSHYSHPDLIVAGMSESDYQSLYNQDIPLERRWALMRPYWQEIRHNSYSRATLLAVEKFYQFEDIDDETYQPLSKAMQEANRPGIYERVLKDECKIRLALTQCGSTKLDSPLLIPVMPMLYGIETWQALSNPPFDLGVPIRSLDDYLDALRSYVCRVKAEGAVGLKMIAGPNQKPDREAALGAFESLRKGVKSCLPTPNPLRDYLTDQMISFVTEQDLVIAVHTGYWGDFRQLDPLHMIPILQRHPRSRFDIYHLGYPWMRETLMLGKGFPNVWLNWCWTYIISQRFAEDAIDEAIDLIPMNKILAFGGDFGLPVEQVYGHLVMAREDIAAVLARRVVNKQMNESQALELARKWFWDNPRDLYHLEV